MVEQQEKRRRRVVHQMPPAGTRLRGKTKGQEFHAEVVELSNGKAGVGILFKGKVYRSMSGAARAATGHSVDGWLFWKVAEEEG